MSRECQTSYCDCTDITHMYQETILFQILILLLLLLSLFFLNNFLTYRWFSKDEQISIIPVSDSTHGLPMMIDIIDLIRSMTLI